MTTTLLDLPLAKVHPHPGNPRRDLGDLTELADSIREHGVLEPVVVAPDADRADHYVIIGGHRRHAASKVAKTKTIPAVIREDLTAPADQLAAALAENLQRVDLTPVEEADGYTQLLAFDGYDVARVAKATGRSQRTVKLRLGLGRLSEDVRDRIQSLQIPLDHAEVMAAYARKPAQLEQLERVAGTNNFAVAVQRIRDDESRERDIAAAKKMLEQRGVPVVKSYEWSDSLSSLGISEADHKDCPGHAAFVDRYQTVFICTDPVGNGHRTAPAADGKPGPTTQTAAQKREEAAAEARVADLGAARTVRLKFLQNLLRMPTPDALAALTPIALRQIGGDWYLDEDGDALELLGITEPDREPNEEPETGFPHADWVQAATAGWDHVQTFAWVLACAALVVDPKPSRWPFHHAEPLVEYFGALEAAGYVLSDVERSLLPVPEPVVDEAAEASV